MSFFERFVRPALLEFSDRPALVHNGRVQTYAELNRSFNRVGNALRTLGLSLGDHSAILQYNSDRWLECEGGQGKVGITTVPLNTRLSPQEVAWHLNDSESRAVIFRPRQAMLLESIRDQLTTCTHLLCIPEEGEDVPDWAVDFDELLDAASDAEPDTMVPPETLYRLMYTSATTGKPKGVPVTHSHFSLHTATTLVNQLAGVSEQDRYLPVTPFTHMAIGFVWPFLSRGGTVVCTEGWNPAEFLELCAENEVTYSLLAPTVIISLLRHLEDHPEAVSTWQRAPIKAVWYAASPIPVEIAKRAEAALGNVLNQMYGLTELLGNGTSMTCTQLTAEWHSRKPGTCGRAQRNNVVRVVDDQGVPLPAGQLGEVVVLAEQPSGYWRQPEQTSETIIDGWFHTGDVGHFDEDGFLTITDRKKDMIISGGLNVYPTEVENIMYQHSGVEQCAVIGVADDYWVEVPCAIVVRKPGATCDEAELIEFVRERLAHFKAPKAVVFVDELPVSAAGKVLKRELRQRYGDVRAGSISRP